VPRLNRHPTRHPTRHVLLLPVLALAATFALTACGNGGVAEQSKEHSVVTGAEGTVGDLKILDATLTTGDTTTTASLSLTVYDQGQSGDALTGVTSPMASGFALPSTDATGAASTDATGASSTSTAVTIPAMGDVSFYETTAIGVTGLTGSPLVGDSVPVTLTFAGAGSLGLDVPVVGSDAPSSGSTPTPAVTGANVDGGNPSPAVSAATG
jgi:copper(I)-binding protein